MHELMQSLSCQLSLVLLFGEKTAVLVVGVVGMEAIVVVGGRSEQSSPAV